MYGGRRVLISTGSYLEKDGQRYYLPVATGISLDDTDKQALERCTAKYDYQPCAASAC